VVVRNVSALAPRRATGELRRRLGIGDAPLVLHQGAPAPQRGCEVLVRAMPHVAGAHLVLLGDEGEPGFAGTLVHLARAERVHERVHLVPGVPLDRLLEVTAEADVGVSLLQDSCENHRLALPNKVFEYLAAGVPVVVSDLPELRRLVGEHGVGWVVPPGDPHAVAAGLRAALAERGDAARRDAVARAAKTLSWARERRRLTSTYSALEAAARTRP
jgi:glycosyltransferase involved in cell wall biosynthesis